MKSETDQPPLLSSSPAFLISKIYLDNIKAYLQKKNRLPEEPETDSLRQMIENSEGLRIERIAESLLMVDASKKEILTNVSSVIHKRKAKILLRQKITASNKIAARVGDFKRDLVRLNAQKKHKKKYSLTITPIN